VGILWFAIAAFFRDPLFRKPATNDPRDLVSPADGVISAIEQVDQHAATGGPAVIVRIFLSVLDVHINRMPCACSIVSVVHTPGQYLDARSPESAKVNESNLLVLDAAGGTRIGVRQVSGAIARRIVCPVVPGQRFERAARFGMIKFGSTTELIIPAAHASTVRVQKGARVVGGVTILASISAASPSH
jgi:phosphatidylserine decarboxylase